MPFSNCEQITPIITQIREFRPASVLDVGCGVGLYGVLCRVFLDLYDDESFMRKLENPTGGHWQVRIDGIEGTPAYLPFIPTWAYDHLHGGDALERLAELPDQSYDLVLALAILEHFDTEQGLAFVRHLKRVGRRVILSVPKKVMPQEVPGCPYETHRSQWSEQDLVDCGFNRFIPHFGAWIAVCDPFCNESGSGSAPPELSHQANGNGFASAYAGADNGELKAILAQMNQTLQQICQQQEITNNQRLSIRFRLNSWLGRQK